MSYAGFLQTEEMLTLLKKLSPAEAECVIDRLTSWARIQLEDKDHISDEVQNGTCYLPKSAFYVLLFVFEKEKERHRSSQTWC